MQRPNCSAPFNTTQPDIVQVANNMLRGRGNSDVSLCFHLKDEESYWHKYGFSASLITSVEHPYQLLVHLRIFDVVKRKGTEHNSQNRSIFYEILNYFDDFQARKPFQSLVICHSIICLAFLYGCIKF